LGLPAVQGPQLAGGGAGGPDGGGPGGFEGGEGGSGDGEQPGELDVGVTGDDGSFPVEEVSVFAGVGQVGDLADAGLLGLAGERPISSLRIWRWRP
jgi:hypothetical protein